jgi:hypothetical protein
VRPTLYRHAARLPILADKGYTPAPAPACTRRSATCRRRHTAHRHRTYDHLITDLRGPTERAHALLGYWQALERTTVCPQRISTIAAAALVLTSMLRGRR